MGKDDSKNKGLIAPKPILKRLNWTQEYRRGPDESVDDPPLFSSTGSDFELDESLSVDFGWPTLSSTGQSSYGNELAEDTTEAFTPDIKHISSKLGDIEDTQSEAEALERLEDLNRIPKLLMDEPDLVWQRLNHREGYVLSQIDGSTSFADIIEIAGLAEDKTRRILVRLLRAGVIG